MGMLNFSRMIQDIPLYYKGRVWLLDLCEAPSRVFVISVIDPGS